jgi:hypothetical protein
MKNVLVKLNRRHASNKRQWLCLVDLAVALALVLCTASLCMYYQASVTFEVTADETEPAQELAGAPSFDEIFESVAPFKPVQTVTIRLNAHSFNEGAEGVHLLSYVPPADQHEKNVSPRVQLASRSQEFALPKPEPKKSAPAPVRVKLSSDNWDSMTPGQKWLVANAYAEAHNWICDDEGLSKKQQIKKLADHPEATWGMVLNFGFTHCKAKS